MQPNKYDKMIGQIFGRWEVVNIGDKGFVDCICSCGTRRCVSINNLKMGRSKSCGCLQKEIVSEIKNLHDDRENNDLSYQSWVGMKTRCNNPNFSQYKDYGGKGITYDTRWESFENFLKDMGPRSDKTLTLDRIKSNQNYCKENCRWADKSLQSFNKENHENKISGVNLRKNGKWQVCFSENGKLIYLGTYESLLDAAEVRALAELERYGFSKVKLKRY